MEDWWHIGLRSLAAVAVLFTIARLLGKKQISQLSFFEYITGIVIGELAGFISTELEAHFIHGLTAMLVWFVVPLFLEHLTLKSKRLRDVLEGKGTVFIRHGRVLEENLRKERFSSDELMEELRAKKVFRLADVEFAMLEASGELSILTKEEARMLKPEDAGAADECIPQAVIMDGHLMDDALCSLGMTREWLFGELDKQGLTVQDVFLAQIDAKGKLYIDLYEDGYKPPVLQAPSGLLTALKQCESYLIAQGQRTDSSDTNGVYAECASMLGDIIRRVENDRMDGVRG
ncbi:DUF421 domain-containing protein [Paenibacillus mucilaginosus]|uniref:DUF421 domain-containing protein n=1 Tax=Paenibacillus mucilaginosus (strain KNP414) TaxID=1036673 RepID=F8FFV1_PAEMK|nr:DUF421 domain-containing protein [Paenibacillus mucilaginosus]AEI42728.1 hypothetical protein KNP414_04196 [Paenibacillus mucilaginosus KNP414]MCG7217029.1 DUF421 domain-containing protein [Paenibacillus mucilaginosus]WDM26106.1 DUF421 domain-containing protein [Paenibacillus mucilaginosus]